MIPSRRFGLWLTISNLFFLASLVAPSALAAVPDAKRVEARERFDRGLTLFNQGDNEGALAEFQRAYQLTNNATVLYNIARVYAAANEPVAALDALDQLLSQASDLPSARRALAETLRGEQRLRVGSLTITCPSALTAARIEIDGADAGELVVGKALRLAAGRHVVGVLAPGHLPLRKVLLLAGQEQKTEVFAPEPLQGALGKMHFAL
ncbi:MAG TPA: tetratricopeptide repeat protein, partial [Polyangiaceae bacterium]|nr:tetratricopeptide repeat protein [Polyangiaceae bacterium]